MGKRCSVKRIGLLGLGAALMLHPATSSVGVGLVGGAAVDTAADLTFGKEIEDAYGKWRKSK